MTIKIVLRIGHPAYTGANAVRVCFSKAQAVRVLRNRGAKRDDARIAVATALRDVGSSCKLGDYQYCELMDYMPSIQRREILHTPAELAAQWRNAPEA
jgi:hypothetical protein